MYFVTAFADLRFNAISAGLFTSTTESFLSFALALLNKICSVFSGYSNYLSMPMVAIICESTRFKYIGRFAEVSIASWSKSSARIELIVAE